MSRSRNIKPGFFTNDILAEIEPLGRLLFAGLWTIADREGRLEDRPKRIKMETLPYDNCNIDDLLQVLTDRKFIFRYQVKGKPYIQILNFSKHQNPHKNEKPSEFPAPELYSVSMVQVQEYNEPLLDKSEKPENVNINKPSNINRLKEYSTSTVQVQDKHSTNRADSFNLIPDSLNMNPESINLNPSTDDGQDFLDWWNIYPRHGKENSMTMAMKAWDELIVQGVSARDLIAAATKYAIKVRADKLDEKWMKMPHNFLLDGVYKDYLPAKPVKALDCPNCKDYHRCRGAGAWMEDEPYFNATRSVTVMCPYKEGLHE